MSANHNHSGNTAYIADPSFVLDPQRPIETDFEHYLVDEWPEEAPTKKWSTFPCTLVPALPPTIKLRGRKNIFLQ